MPNSAISINCYVSQRLRCWPDFSPQAYVSWQPSRIFIVPRFTKCHAYEHVDILIVLVELLVLEAALWNIAHPRRNARLTCIALSWKYQFSAKLDGGFISNDWPESACGARSSDVYRKMKFRGNASLPPVWSYESGKQLDIMLFTKHGLICVQFTGFGGDTVDDNFSSTFYR